jgi:hypothetical protein
VAGRLRLASPRVVADKFLFLPLGAIPSFSTEISCRFHEPGQREVPRCGDREKNSRVSSARPNSYRLRLNIKVRRRLKNYESAGSDG